MKKLTKEKWLELFFYAFILAIWIAWAWILPFNEGPDEYMRSRIVEYIVEYGKLPTGYQQEIMDYSWGFTYGFRPILPQILRPLRPGVCGIRKGDREEAVRCSPDPVAVHAAGGLPAAGGVPVYLSEL